MAEAVADSPQDVAIPEDKTAVSRLAKRDGAIALAAISAWAAADTWHLSTGLGFAGLVALVNALVVGSTITLMAHEWGHFAGARLTGGIAPTREFTSFFPIFDFDMQRSSAASFRAMGVGGNLGHWAVFVILILALPLDTLGRQALVCTVFARALGASITEFPVLQRAYAGASNVESFAGLTGDKLRRDKWIGAAAGLLLFLLL